MQQNYYTVIGAGAWGTAIAHLLATNGHWVCLYTHEHEVALSINQEHENKKYLAGITLPPTVWATQSVEIAAQAEMIFVATPVAYLRSSLQPFHGLITTDKIVVALCKGIENDTLSLPIEVMGETLGVARYAVLGGPSFAREVATKQVTGVVVASRYIESASHVASALMNSYFKVTVSDDVVGVQLCGALKNVLALQSGIITGQAACDNTRAYLLTQGIADMMTVVDTYGGKRKTVYGLAGLGDVMLCALCSTQSRNYQLGELLGKGKTIGEAVAMFLSPPEGLNTVVSMQGIIARYQLDVPVLSTTCDAILGVVEKPHS